MTIYKNTKPGSSIGSVEFAKASDGSTYTFYHLKQSADVGKTRSWLEGALSQKILSETPMGNETILVANGNADSASVLQTLKNEDTSLSKAVDKKKMDPWKLRGWASMIGQPLQLASGYLNNKFDAGTVGFASLNIVANVINIIFGAQKKTDTHHLRYVKGQLNEKIGAYLPEGTDLPDINDSRLQLRDANEHGKKGNKAYDFMKRNSVTFGEIGLRYLGSIFLAFPLTKANAEGKQSFAHWKSSAGQLMDGQVKAAYKGVVTADKANLYAGMAYIGGKTLAFMSKVPDPYGNHKKKHSAMDTFREQVVFRLSSTIEAVAAMVISLDRLNLVSLNKKPKMKNGQVVMEEGKVVMEAVKREISLDKIIKKVKNPPQWLKNLEGRKSRDWLGGIGGLLFTAGLVVRIFAPFGVREVNMKELDAHASDSLALVPKDKLPQALAETTAHIQDHFKTRKIEFSTLYTQLADDLQRQHSINVCGKAAADMQTAQTPEAEPVKTFARPELKKASPTSMVPPASFQDRANATQDAAMRSV